MKFCLRDTAGSPERARWLHLARSGSQSQRAIWFILPARKASHIISGFNKRLFTSKKDAHFMRWRRTVVTLTGTLLHSQNESCTKYEKHLQWVSENIWPFNKDKSETMNKIWVRKWPPFLYRVFGESAGCNFITSTKHWFFIAPDVVCVSFLRYYLIYQKRKIQKILKWVLN